MTVQYNDNGPSRSANNNNNDGWMEWQVDIGRNRNQMVDMNLLHAMGFQTNMSNEFLISTSISKLSFLDTVVI